MEVPTATEFNPQHLTVPSVKTAQVCVAPAATAVAEEIPETVTGEK